MSTDDRRGGLQARGTDRQCLVRAAVLLALLGSSASGQAQNQPQNFADALTNGDANLNLRYRWEHVDQDNITKSADASTLRLRLNYTSLPYRDVQAFVEFDYVAELLIDDFNSGGGTSPNRTQYPVVADPDGADLNQLYVDYLGVPNTKVRLGRQRILLDNQRFVGGVGWRQNEQTYDAVSFQYEDESKIAASYSFVTRVNRIFGDRSPSGRNDSSTHLLNLRWSLPDNWTATAYAYQIDDEDVTSFSTTTVGASLKGGIAVAENKLSLGMEFASQTDAAAAPINFRASYYRFDAAYSFSRAVSAGIGIESLGGNSNSPGRAFRTPLATLHAFQGWADQFLSTPDAGVEDLFATVSAKPGDWTFTAAWHRFSAEDGAGDWGTELDVSAGRKLGHHYGLLLKAGLFYADDPSFADTRKIWLMLSADF